MGNRTVEQIRVLALAGVLGAAGAARGQSDFATAVLEYRPAPGQFVQNPLYNDPTRALGPPVGGGTVTQDNTKVVSLGGFGGSITLAFDHTVMDDPRNPFGMDAIVFGNAIWAGGDPTRRFAEAAIIEISRDVNGNSIPDDPWYVIPGTHIGKTVPPAHQATVQFWDDDFDDPTYPPMNPLWLPVGLAGQWSTEAILLPPEVFNGPVVVNPLGPDSTLEGVYGYADVSPTLILGDTDGDNIVDDPFATPETFYTRPDDPYTVGITPGSGGGDAFDIAWAVVPETGEPAGLDGFDFIRITNGVNRVNGILGEISPEISGVADVRPVLSDFNADGRVNSADISAFLAAWLAALGTGYDPAVDFSGDGQITSADISAFLAAWLMGR